MDDYPQITSMEQLRALVGEPIPRVRDKVRATLDDLDREWLTAAPFCVLSTSDEHGNADVSPKGDPPGFVRVLDDRTIAIPDRPGNRRVDGFANLLADPHLGLLFIVPGRTDTLRINGRGRLITDAPFFDDMIVGRNRPSLVLLVEVDEVFYHCPKAFLRSRFWDTSTWHPDDLPSRAQIAQKLERPDDSIEALEAYYGPEYAERLYG